MTMKTWTGRSLLSAILVLQVASFKHECKLPLYSFQEAFKVFAIVPQVIPVAPKAPLIRYYGDYKLRFGNRIPVAVTNSLSLYSSWPNVDANALYTMITSDLDYPQFYFNEGVQFINGIIVNIPGANYSRGERIIGYHPPSPLPGAGDNRILTLVCEQKTGRIDITTELILR
ncbi:26 kDa secreted antigen-like [Bicyclus anynana]|uniref:26 kDa secreted antigen-like n=1 Tax=Bicyclus anynana TaxID=110368 RepID=A0A6J1NW49_BICAN|nr:26 kDa secreted antigen-like [Bicyclus anynana]